MFATNINNRGFAGKKCTDNRKRDHVLFPFQIQKEKNIQNAFLPQRGGTFVPHPDLKYETLKNVWVLSTAKKALQKRH